MGHTDVNQCPGAATSNMLSNLSNRFRKLAAVAEIPEQLQQRH